MSSPSELLFQDVRAGLVRQVLAVSGQGDMDEAFAAWLLVGEDIGLVVERAARLAASRLGGERTYRDVATLGFAAANGLVGIDEKTALEVGLRWLAGRTAFVDGLPTGVCVDAVAILGIALGAKHIGDDHTEKLVKEWMSSFIGRSYQMRDVPNWSKCILAAARHVIDSAPPLAMPGDDAVADVRVALYSSGLFPVPEATVKEQDEVKTLSLSKREAGAALEPTRAALRLAAFDAINRTVSILPGQTAAAIEDKVEVRKNKMIKVLFLTANPTDSTRLRLDAEFRAIDEKLRQSQFRDIFELKHQPAVRVSDLQDHFLRHDPDIVHFSGHGSDNSEIILEDDSGRSQAVPVRALSSLFAALKENIRCVVLNACYSEQQAQAIAQHIECVVGMSQEISDSAAINFATAFYRALAYGKNVKTSFELGCTQIDLDSLDERDTPKLITLNCDPRDIFFAGRDRA
ncbi:MAG TPA: CHAT domain-containing protein [Blastocatellia bacterium]|jgi:hypothetical protein